MPNDGTQSDGVPDSRNGKGVPRQAAGASRNQRKDAFQEVDGQQGQKLLGDLKYGAWSLEGHQGFKHGFC